MKSLAVRVENVSKQFQRGTGVSYLRFSELLQNAARRLVSAPFRVLERNSNSKPKVSSTIEALREVSFDVQQGEVVGIIGRNGAGKSTLLKILSRITRPSSGRIGVCGRVGSLLEVGTGFHPELTGRENVYLNGAILGMSRRDVRDKFDAIVDFSELESFLDTPVKRYSSGMYTRLAFAVAAHLEPEILVVDEVLAVGDLAFQKKSLGKMSELSKSGRTVLFVSHNIQAVQGLCDRVILLDEGRIVEDGEPFEVTNRYLRQLDQGQYSAEWFDSESANANKYVRLHRAAVKLGGAKQADCITMDTPFDVEIEYSQLLDDVEIDLTLVFFFEGSTIAFPTSTVHQSQALGSRQAGRYRCICKVPGGLLRDGPYSLNLLMIKDKSDVILKQEDVLSLFVAEAPERRGAWFGKRRGVVCPLLDWTITSLDTESHSD